MFDNVEAQECVGYEGRLQGLGGWSTGPLRRNQGWRFTGFIQLGGGLNLCP